MEIGERLASVLDDRVDVGAGEVHLKASVGVAWTAEVIDADALIAQADSASDASKRSESHRTTLFIAPAAG